MGIENIEAAIGDDEPKLTFFVVAPDYQWFVNWCVDNQINYRDNREAVFVNSMLKVQGHQLSSKNQIIDLGPFDRKRYELVLALTHRIKA
jgi:hypothetical protein